MRVISGSLKGKEYLRRPKNSRPTKSVLKEALLMTLLSYKQSENSDLICFADICCGSGAVGIEFLSSGYQNAILMDIDIKPVIENLKRLNLDHRTTIYRRDFRKIRSNMSSFGELNNSDLFFDPPYHYWKEKNFMKEVRAKFDMICPLTLSVEHPVDDEITFSFDRLSFLWKRNFGDSALSFFCRREDDN